MYVGDSCNGLVAVLYSFTMAYNQIEKRYFIWYISHM